MSFKQKGHLGHAGMQYDVSAPMCVCVLDRDDRTNLRGLSVTSPSLNPSKQKSKRIKKSIKNLLAYGKLHTELCVCVPDNINMFNYYAITTSQNIYSTNNFTIL